MKRNAWHRAGSILVSMALCMGMLPASSAFAGPDVPQPQAAPADTGSWKMQYFGTDTDLEIQEGWLIPDADGNGVTVDYGKIYTETGERGNVVVYDSAAPIYQDSTLEFDITVTGGQPNKYQVAVFPRFQSGKNCDGFAIGEAAQLQHSYQVNGSEGWPGVDNKLSQSFAVDETYHLKLVTIADNMTVYLDDQELTSFETNPSIADGGYGFRVWTQAEEKTVHIDNIVRTPISSLTQNSAEIPAADWGKTDLEIPVNLASGSTVQSVSSGETVLAPDTDYTVQDGKIVVKADYIQRQTTGFALSILFSDGGSGTFTVTKGVEEMEPELLHYYTFDERSGDTYADTSGSADAADGVKNGSVTSVPGRNGRAIKLGSGCVDVDSKAFQNLTTFTVSAWINWDGSLSASNTILSGHGDWFHVRKQGGNDRKLWVDFWEGGGTWTSLGPESKEVTANEWVHVAYVRDENGVSLYMNGELMGRREGVSNPTGDKSVFSIGGDGANGGLHPFHGMIDEVKIFSTPLSAQQIAEIVAQPADVRSVLGKTSVQFLPEDWGKTDIEIPVTFGEGDSLKYVVNAATGETVDPAYYTSSGSSITVKKEYTASQTDSFTLYFFFEKGSDAEFTVTKLDITYREYTWTPDKGLDEWEKLAGEGSFEMAEDGSGMLVTGEAALLNTAAPQLIDGEIEITFDQKTDDSYAGFLFRCGDDMSSWQAVRCESYNKWRYTDSTGARVGVYGDGSNLYSRDGEADTKLKIRFENGVVSLWMDDQFMATNTVSQAVSAKGGVGLYTQSTTNMVVKKVTFRSFVPFLAQQDDSGSKTIEADGLKVTLADDFPRVKEYALNGKVMKGAEFKHNYVTVNSVNIPAAVEITAESANTLTYTVTPERGAAESFDVVYTVKDGGVLEMRINNIREKSGELVYSINLPNQPIISANSRQEGAKLDATTFYPCLQGEDGDWDQTILTDEHFTVSENKIRKNADMMATLAFVTNGELSASITNNVLYNVRELRYRAFDLPDGSVSAGVWNSEYMYRGLDGKKIFPIASEPEEEDLYCRVILTEDTNADNQLDWQDGANALKQLVGDRVPGADNAARSFFEVGYNFASGAQQPFIKVGDNLKRMSNLIDGFSQILVFKGYANEGHDSGHSDYDDINRRAGGAEDLNAMTDAIREINSIFGIHINHSECYPEAKMFNDHTMSTLNGWAWMDQSKGLRREVDILNTQDGQRTMDERLDTMFENSPDIGFVYVDTYGDDRWAETRLADALVRNGAMVGTENKIDFDRYASWVHWPGVSSDGMHHFVYHTQKDIYTGSSMYWGGYTRSGSFMSWQHNNNISPMVEQFYTNQLPQKYLMCHEVLRQDGNTAYFAGNITSSNYVITKDGNKITDGSGKIFIPWYDENSETKNPDEAAKIYHWNAGGGDTTWTLPVSWQDLDKVYLYKNTQTGKQLDDTLDVTDGQVTIHADAKTPYVVYPAEAEADETDWSTGSPLKDTGFNSRDFSIWQKDGEANIFYEDDGNGVSILNMTGAAEGSVSQTMTGLVPGQKYRVMVHAGAENGKTARITVENGGKSYENYLEQVVMQNQYFDSYVKGKMMQRMWVDFVAEDTTATVTLSGDACDSADGKVTFMESRIVKTAEPDLPAGYVANETFEYVEQGAYGIFNPERSADGVPHLSETHLPYTTDTITGDWSLKLYGHYGQGDVTVRTSPATMRLQPNTEYTVEFDTLGDGKVYVQSEANEADRVLEQSFAKGHSKYTFTTGDSTDYIVRIERGSVLDNFQVYEPAKTVPVTGVALDKTELELTAGETEQLTATVLPENAANKQVSWTTDNEAAAAVDENGKVTAVAEGTAVITVTTADGGFTASCTATVKPVPKYTLTVVGGEGSGEYTEARQVTVTATVPEGQRFVKWKAEGVTLETPEAQTVTFAMPANDVKLTAVFEKIPPETVPVTGVKLDKTELTMTVGETAKLTATVLPGDATEQGVLWNSTNNQVITVSADGTVKAMGEGSATITVITKDGGFTASCTVTVKAQSTPVPTASPSDGGSTGGEQGSLPATGDSSLPLVCGLLLCAAGARAAVLRRKKES